MKIMEEIHNPFTILFNKLDSLEKSNKKIESKIGLILERLGEVDLHDKFSVKTQIKAAEILDISVEALQNKIKEGKLKKEIHYRMTTSTKKRNLYFFNKVALLSDKGLL